MFDFVYLLRIIAAVLITNSHYEAIYPISVIANGGLLGDVLFFAVSGFCLFPVKYSFPKWYQRRLKRIYPLVWIVSVIYLLFGFYEVHSFQSFVKLMIYPTHYHFVASILLLYIVYYFVARILCAVPAKFDNRFRLLVTILCISYAMIYCTIYDRSYYHIDNVREPMIEFIYFFAMMIGLWFRHHKEKYIGIPCIWSWPITIILFMAYFASKIAFSRGILPSSLQFVNQMILLSVLLFLFRGFIGLEEKLHQLPKRIREAIAYIAGFAFEIYLVQYALIPRLNIGPFPLNFLLVSGTILVAAFTLHLLHKWVMGSIEIIVNKRNR